MTSDAVQRYRELGILVIGNEFSIQLFEKKSSKHIVHFGKRRICVYSSEPKCARYNEISLGFLKKKF